MAPGKAIFLYKQCFSTSMLVWPLGICSERHRHWTATRAPRFLATPQQLLASRGAAASARPSVPKIPYMRCPFNLFPCAVDGWSGISGILCTCRCKIMQVYREKMTQNWPDVHPNSCANTVWVCGKYICISLGEKHQNTTKQEAPDWTWILRRKEWWPKTLRLAAA